MFLLSLVPSTEFEAGLDVFFRERSRFFLSTSYPGQKLTSQTNLPSGWSFFQEFVVPGFLSSRMVYFSLRPWNDLETSIPPW